MKKLTIACSAFLIAACGGPSNKDIEELQNTALFPVQMIAKVAPDKTGCPVDVKGFEKLTLDNKKVCLASFAEIKNVDIENCIEKEKTVYFCAYTYEFVSEKYGIHEFEAKGVYEEMPEGWTIKR